MLEIVLVMLCGLTSRVMTKDAVSKGRFNTPVLDVTEQQIILEKNQTLQLNCRGRWELEWVLPSGMSKSHQSAHVEVTRCGKQKSLYCSRLVLRPALAQHTGSYRCRYAQKQQKYTSVYVFIRDSQQPFVKVQKEIPDVVYMKEGQDLVFPCRVTNPDTKVSLVKFPDRRLGTDQRNIIWNNRKGFVIRSPTYFYIGLFSCETIINGTKHTNKFLTYRPVNKIQQVYLNSTGSVQALQGERLALNCTVTAELNSRVNINWSYPGKANSSASVSRRITRSRSNVVFYSVLTIHKLHKADKGTYTCHVTSGPANREVNTSVIVYDKPFIRLKHRDGARVQAYAGQKSFRLSPKLRAFPQPEIIWLKDGMVAAEHCSRYHVDGYSLVIRDVAEEDAGVYTILTRIQQYGLHQNLTLSLVVNVKPQIGEKAVAARGTITMPRTSRQVFRCTAQGIPPPQIQWLWHGCPSKGLCEELASSSSSSSPPSSFWTAVTKRTADTSTYNPILSVTQTQEMLQGKNKTIGILTVGKALLSGIYRCVASNSMGTDELDIRFYVTDVQGGFRVSGASEEGPREGRDHHLSCVANKHLYTNMSWHRVAGSSGGTPLVGELTEGEYSFTLRVTLTNLTGQDSGMYRCSATHLLTGQQSHQDALVSVTGLEAPVLLQNLTDCSVNVSNSVTLQCPASGVPRPLITWYKDRRRLKQVSGIMLAPEDGTLHIGRITAEDEGLYTCEATNERGSAESSAYISVENSESFSREIPTLACTCVVATLFWLLLTLLIRKLRQSNSTSAKTEYLPIILHQGEGPLDEHCDRLQYDPEKWEFPQERLQLEKPLGRGAFGKVMQASAFGISNSSGCTTVAVKMLKEGATPSEHKALMTELKILNHIGHHLNVVNLLGACTRPGGPLMVIVEYCKYGNLSSFLRSKRDVFSLNRVKGEEERGEQDECKSCIDSKNCQKVISAFNETEKDNGSVMCSNYPVHLEDLISYSFQVARGMEFLSSRKCIHRDLAARNILLSDNNVVKICDFGLARDLYKDPDYVRKGDARLPLKWMSPESIFDKVFTTQSDVWSYGVLLWEIFSLGASPYPGLNIDEEFCHRLKQGTRMRAPEYSTPEIYKTMLSCWERNPSDRPTFTLLVGTLGDLLQARVQQDGKDYIPLNTFPSGESDVEHLDYRDTHQGTQSYINTRINTITTFEEDLNRDVPEDSQSDSGMVLPSEEFIQLKWTDKFKTNKITRFFLKSQYQERMPPTSALPCVSVVPCGQVKNNTAAPCSAAPSDYNTAPLYPSL